MLCPSCDHDNIAGSDLCENCGMDLAGLDIKAWGVDPEDPALAVSLENLPLKQARILEADATVAEAVAAMRESHEGCVFVGDGEGRLIGIFTERDLTGRVVARSRHPGQTRLGDVMTPNPVTLRTGDPLAWALHRMGVDGYRHLPVVDSDKIVGLLSARVVMRWMLEGA
jgi:CBS domain-containing protein